ncbi:MAG: tRNA (cytidine(34)-2'-O)-methyltransferase [Oscillospiraceae bacterium]|jgi:tRNA (cytidine/uridine-2'-O-)-methyltransferase|nr:tRNA (cytidine(34)-2'-O)-methyltransferase [Oscillospiraceae bacterium]
MPHIVLVEPEIPQNTGNISRTCAATGCPLHLVKPLGFSLADKYLKRAGLDYWPLLDLTVYDSFDAFWPLCRERRFWLLSTKAPRAYTEAAFAPDDFLLFGRETAGLPETLLRAHPDRALRIPMRPGLRSLNLSNSVAIVLFEALRQHGFPGLTGEGDIGGRPVEGPDGNP